MSKQASLKAVLSTLTEEFNAKSINENVDGIMIALAEGSWAYERIKSGPEGIIRLMPSQDMRPGETNPKKSQ